MPKNIVIDLEYLNLLSKQNGFRAEILEKAYRLLHILSIIESLPELHQNLALKGGTAINFIYHNIPRLSVDIDFNFVGIVDKKEMLIRRKVLESILEKQWELVKYNAKINPSYIITRYLLRYKNVFGGADQIKVEINYLDRIPVIRIVPGKLINLFESEQPTINTYTLEELFAGKVCALLQRYEPRDLFDVFMLEKKDVDLALLRKLFVFYYCKNADPRDISLPKTLEISEDIAQRRLGQLLPKDQVLSFNVMKQGVFSFLSTLLKFTSSEREFITRLYEQGIYSPELLFGKVKYNPDIINHPGIQLVLNKLKKQ